MRHPASLRATLLAMGSDAQAGPSRLATLVRPPLHPARPPLQRHASASSRARGPATATTSPSETHGSRTSNAPTFRARDLATNTPSLTTTFFAPPPPGATSPQRRYEELVQRGLLTDDNFQRSIVARLQDLHERLLEYTPRLHDVEEYNKMRHAAAGGGLFARLFGGGVSTTAGVADNLEIAKDMPKGLYLYGDVGTGKSMLMDLFYDTLPPNIKTKRRIHFHQFMIDAHKRMHAFKLRHHKPSSRVMSATGPGGGRQAQADAVRASNAGTHGRTAVSEDEEVDPIPYVAREFAEEASVLCFDEFQVTDIADAMILRRLLEHMLWHGVVLVTTSNRHPDELYKNGIQRSSFLPCIDLLKSQLEVTDLNSGTDYRKVPRALSKVYYSPATPENRLELDKIFDALTSDPSDLPKAGRQLQVWGRNLTVPLSSSRVARFSFQELCGKPRSAADYIEICRRFHTVFVDDVPRMGLNQRDVARRMITFIDAAYEAKVKLFALSEVPMLQIFSSDDDKGPARDTMRALMDELGLTMGDLGGSPIFTGEEELFAFARVISRLTEMSSKHYAELSASAHHGD